MAAGIRRSDLIITAYDNDALQSGEYSKVDIVISYRRKNAKKSKELQMMGVTQNCNSDSVSSCEIKKRFMNQM